MWLIKSISNDQLDFEILIGLDYFLENEKRACIVVNENWNWSNSYENAEICPECDWSKMQGQTCKFSNENRKQGHVITMTWF